MKTKFTIHHCFYLVGSLLALSLSRCHQESAQPGPSHSSKKEDAQRLLVATSSNFFNGIDKIEYDVDQKPTKIIGHGPGSAVNVSYAGNQVTYDFVKFGRTFARRIYDLENDIAKKSVFYSVDSTGAATQLVVTTYAYEAGKLHKETVETAREEDNYYCEYFYDDVKENVIAREIHALDGSLKEKRTYTYTSIPDKSVLFNLWTNNNADGTLFPRWSKYLIEKITIEYNGVVSNKAFTYELDQDGYVVYGKSVSDHGPQKTTEWTYTWQ